MESGSRHSSKRWDLQTGWEENARMSATSFVGVGSSFVGVVPMLDDDKRRVDLDEYPERVTHKLSDGIAVSDVHHANYQPVLSPTDSLPVSSFNLALNPVAAPRSSHRPRLGASRRHSLSSNLSLASAKTRSSISGPPSAFSVHRSSFSEPGEIKPAPPEDRTDFGAVLGLILSLLGCQEVKLTMCLLEQMQSGSTGSIVTPAILNGCLQDFQQFLAVERPQVGMRGMAGLAMIEKTMKQIATGITRRILQQPRTVPKDSGSKEPSGFDLLANKKPKCFPECSEVSEIKRDGGFQTAGGFQTRGRCDFRSRSMSFVTQDLLRKDLDPHSSGCREMFSERLQGTLVAQASVEEVPPGPCKPTQIAASTPPTLTKLETINALTLTPSTVMEDGGSASIASSPPLPGKSISEVVAMTQDAENVSLSSFNGNSEDSCTIFEPKCEEEAVDQNVDLDDLSLEQIQWLASRSDRWVISPNQRLRVLWDLSALCFILFECVSLPLMMCFQVQVPDNVHLVSTIFFGVDMLLNLTTGYFLGSLLVMRRRWLIKRYIRTWALLDFVSTFPWEFIFNSFGVDKSNASGGGETTLLRIAKLGKLARVLRLLRLAKIHTILKGLQTSGLLPASMYELKLGMAIVRMFSIFGLLSHWVACIWGWVGSTENLGWTVKDKTREACALGGPCEEGIVGNAWMQRYGVEDESVVTQYLLALQYASALWTGGEVSMQASTAVERVITVIVMICSVFLVSVVVGQILLIMDRQCEASMAFDEQMHQSREFMVSRKVPLNLQVRVYRYLESQNKNNKDLACKTRDFIGQLSDWLQFELIESLNRTHLARHPFFKQMRVKDTSEIPFRRICLSAEPTLFAAGDTVVEKGHNALCAHWLVTGKLKVMKIGESVYMKPPSWIGDRCLFLDVTRSHSVIAVIPTETLVVQKSIFQEISSEYPDVQELYRDFRAELLKDGWAYLRCLHCGDIGHSHEDCPRLELEKEELNWTRATLKTFADIRRQTEGATLKTFADIKRKSGRLSALRFSR